VPETQLLETLLALPETGPVERAEKWRRIFFRLAHHPSEDAILIAQALDYLRDRKEDAGVSKRREWASSAGKNEVSPLIAEFLEKEDPEVYEAAQRAGDARTCAGALFGKPWQDVRAAQLPDRFRWESDAVGVVRWTDGLPRAALIGLEIGNGGFGLLAAEAFSSRVPFREARYRLESAVASVWRVSGVPYFGSNGCFQGYRGVGLRYPEAAAALAEEGSGLFGTDLPPNALRQLIHELRTPLNAIAGFAEMIQDQHLGAAEELYRDRAAQIRERAARLIGAVDDLDTAARIETSQLMVEEASVDAEALLRRLAAAYQPVAGQRGARIGIDISVPLPLVLVENANAERMFARLLAATIGLARGGETIQASLKADARQKQVLFAIQRPHSIVGLTEAEMLDPGFSPEGEWPGAPALGLGFALRLVRNLAKAVGGSLAVGDEGFLLSLPAASADGQSE
jgi:signal transduction histidine kinase